MDVTVSSLPGAEDVVGIYCRGGGEEEEEGGKQPGQHLPPQASSSHTTTHTHRSHSEEKSHINQSARKYNFEPPVPIPTLQPVDPKTELHPSGKAPTTRSIPQLKFMASVAEPNLSFFTQINLKGQSNEFIFSLSAPGKKSK